MALFPKSRFSNIRGAGLGRDTRRGRVKYLPVVSKLEGRELLSTLTVVNDLNGGLGSLPF